MRLVEPAERGHLLDPDQRAVGQRAVEQRLQIERLEEEYFAEPRASPRASPLGETYGWGLHYDAEGRITLHAVGSESYDRLAADPTLTQLRAMRSKRA